MIPQYAPEFGKEEQEAVYAYMGTGAWLTENKVTQDFEREIARVLRWDRCPEPHQVSVVSNGTISLSLALLACGVKPGDRVIVPDLTMIATANAATFIGAKPVLCDIDPKNLCLDLKKALELATLHEAKAVLYVSLNGRSHAAQGLGDLSFALDEGCHLIEDAAQSFGSKTPDGIPIGTIGSYGSFSFSPHKIISTGQGGCVVSRPHSHWDRPYDGPYEKIELLKDFGRLAGGGDIHDHFGVNAKFTDLQAVVGLEQLKKLPARIQRKTEIYARYEAELFDVVEMIPHQGTPWFVDVYTDRRDELQEHLKKNGIGTRALYPALHTQKIFAEWNPSDAAFPTATAWSKKGLWLPSSFSLTDEEIRKICNHIREFMK